MRRLTVSKTDEQLILPLKTLMRKRHQDASSLNGALIKIIKLQNAGRRSDYCCFLLAE
jgi:hypothetical protein